MSSSTRKALLASGIRVTQYRSTLCIVALCFDGTWRDEYHVTAKRNQLGRVVKALVKGDLPF